MKKVLCNIMALCFCSQGFAYDYKKPLVQSASADSSEYHAFLSLNANYMGFADYQFLLLTNHSINEKVSNLYLKAKQYYYQKQYYKSLVVFKEVKKYIKWLISTYPYINFTDLDIIDSLAEKISETPMRFSNWEIPQKLARFNYLIINGKKHDIFPGKNIKLPKGEFILSLLSDSFYPINKIMSKSDLNSWAPNSEWLNSGTCDNPSLKVNKIFKTSYIFYKNDCVMANDENKKIVLAHSPTRFIPKKINQLKPQNSYNAINYKPQKKYKWIKNKWLWIGLGVVATGLVVANNQGKSKKTSNTKQGF